MKKVYKSTLVVLASLFLLGSCTPQANNKVGAMKSPQPFAGADVSDRASSEQHDACLSRKSRFYR